MKRLTLAFAPLTSVSLLVALASPLALADGTGATAPSGAAAGTTSVNTTVVTLDPSQPGACDRFHQFISNHQLQLSDANMRTTLENQICRPISRNTVVTLVLLQPSDGGDDSHAGGGNGNHTALEINVSAEATHGNSNYFHVSGEVSLSQVWANRHILHVNAEAEYESDSDVNRVVVSPDYMYVLNPHFALFAAASVKHDHDRDLTVGTEEYAGLVYDVFPWAADRRFQLELSAGAGHRFDHFSDGYVRNDLIASYRAVVRATITKQVKLMTAIWFQHMLANLNQAGGAYRAFSFTDFRVLYQLKLEFGNADGPGFHANFGFEDEYWTDPRPGTESNDIRVTAGFGYTWE